MPFIFPCGMAMPSPMPVLPSRSLSRMTFTASSTLEIKPASFREDAISLRTSFFVTPFKSAMTQDSLSASLMFIVLCPRSQSIRSYHPFFCT